MLAAPVPALAQNVDFGDDASRFAKDGECDDMRFSGPGMTDTTLIDSDIRHDATDCRSAYNQGRLTYNGGRRDGGSTGSTYAASGVNHIMWGDDTSKYAKDGESGCACCRAPGTIVLLVPAGVVHGPRRRNHRRAPARAALHAVAPRARREEPDGARRAGARLVPDFVHGHVHRLGRPCARARE